MFSNCTITTYPPHDLYSFDTKIDIVVEDDEGWMEKTQCKVGQYTGWLYAEVMADNIIAAYYNRNYSIDYIGLQLAIFCLAREDRPLLDIVEWQDYCCKSRWKKEWKNIEAARDKHLQLLQIFQ